MAHPLLVLVIFMMACDPWISGDELYGRDFDGDGVIAGLDCNDDAPQISDNERWLDRDGDGFGDAEAGAGCAGDAPEGAVDNLKDCDDDDDSVNPLGTERCDDLDNDCDGLIDDLDDHVSDRLPWHRDEDGDGFGQQRVVTKSCEAPDGYVAPTPEFDCDDSNAEWYPGQIWYLDEDGDGYGDPTRAILSCEPPVGYTIDDSDCDDTDAGRTPETVWYLDPDRDGYGDADDSQQSCDAPEGYGALEAGDCEPDNPAFSATCGWAQVSAGVGHTCALRDSGELVCWGDNREGQCDAPVGDDFIQVSAGDGHSCGVRAGGELECWGLDDGAQLSEMPTTGAFVSVYADDERSCALGNSGGLFCWGGGWPWCRDSYFCKSGDPVANPEEEVYTKACTSRLSSLGLHDDGTITAFYANMAIVGSALPLLEGAIVDVDCSDDYFGLLYEDGTLTYHGYIDTRAGDSGGVDSGLGGYDGLVEDIRDFSFTDNGGGCGVTTAGSLTCWGELGDMEGLEPQDSDFDAIDLGLDHGCAMHTDGRLDCWGADSFGESTPPPVGVDTLGLGRDWGCLRYWDEVSCWGDGPSEFDARPLPAETVSVGGTFGCATYAAGSLTCWGEGAPDVPAAVIADSVAVSAFGGGVCAVDDDGELVCWEVNTKVDGTRHGDDAYVDVATGGAHACALDALGSITCYGDTDTARVSGAPVDAGFVEITSGSAFSCARHLDGWVSCWGNDDSGQVTSVPGLEETDFIALSAGHDHACALRDGGAAECWGASDEPEVTATPSDPFTAIDGGEQFTCGLSEKDVLCWGQSGYVPDTASATGSYLSLSAGDYGVCAVTTEGLLECWGRTSGGNSATLEPEYALTPFRHVDQLSGGNDHLCGLVEGLPVCGGEDSHGQASPPIHNRRRSALDVGGRHSCAVLEDSGTIECWGDDGYGQSTLPSPYAGARYTAISAGDEHSCALTEAGQIRCWGRGDEGQTRPPRGQHLSISTGGKHSCALRADGRVDCWGDDRFGQSSPPEVQFVEVITGGWHSCGLVEDDSAYEGYPVVCWGRDDDQQVRGAPDYRFSELYGGNEFTCGLKPDQRVACWGRGLEGQLDLPRLPGLAL